MCGGQAEPRTSRCGLWRWTRSRSNPVQRVSSRHRTTHPRGADVDWFVDGLSVQHVTFFTAVEFVDRSTVIRLAGELDFSNALILHHHLTSAASRAPDGLIIDIAGVRFADSTALGDLALAIGQRRERGRAAWVISPPRAVARLARICGLEGLFRVALGRQPGPVD